MEESRKKRLYELVIKFFFGTVAIFAIVLVCLKPYSYFEVDSYVLPIESLQYRGTILMTQEDINNAKADMPSLYSAINTYEDLRSSKLCKVDEKHWLAWYFPVYAFFCLPIKLLLQSMNLDQVYAFTLSNALFFLISLIVLYRYVKRTEKTSLFLSIMVVFCPIWIYLNYIGAEPLMFSALIVAMIMWEEEHWKTAALIISITCMMNPGIMGFGIILFVDYFLKHFKENRKFFLNKDGFKKIIKLCCCYVPSLVPFVVNYYYLGTFNPTAGTGDIESVWQRTLAYLFDLNFGLASISIFLIVLYIISFIYSLVKKKRHLFLLNFSVLFTIIVISFHIHINCGMINTARYVLWLYPAYIFSIHGFLKNFLREKKIIYFTVVVTSTAIVIGTFNYNNGFDLYPYTNFNNISIQILDHYPQLYVSFCPSTFHSRNDHIDGGYDTNGFSIYTDSDTGEVRKIMYTSTEENNELILRSLVSSQDEALSAIKEKLASYNDGKIHFINISRKANIQYMLDPYMNSNLYDWLIKYMGYWNKKIDENDAVKECELIHNTDIDEYKKLFEYLPKDTNDSEYVHELYFYLLDRDESVSENESWVNQLIAGKSRFDVFCSFITSSEFQEKHGLN